ncbi:GTPase Era [Congregibacter litoralis]|uniref:GTPase Era n=1 Tax=Congregibacter litoralis KT71 TaxID=314285 RepID=A4A3U4_9GAMM|nr:GTPase Era [Congregibacter litoralis]EAQ99367.1 GTP-binding protein Era [Congregibacter litoralis KT71]
MSKKTRCGYVAIVGRPNVGKSTLLNHLLGQKLSITSRKPQTTRHQVLGIKTTDTAQMLFVDTPGIHGGEDRALNRFMNRTAGAAVAAVDIVVMVVDRGEWRDDDERVLRSCLASDAPLLLVVNKVDLEDNPNAILPSLESLAQRADFAALIPLSALRARNLEVLETEIVQRLPEGPFLFEEDEITDRSTRFLVAEIVREKITRQLGDELPYSTTVEIEEYGHENGIVHISAVILVERKGQKAILIGQKGSRLRQIGTDARQDIERLIDSKVMLNLWVKVRSGWADDERALRSLGYDDGR